MHVICPNCSRRLGDDEVGKVYRCRHCGEVFRVGEELSRPDSDNLEIGDPGREIGSPSIQAIEVTESPDMSGGPEPDQTEVQPLAESAFPSGDKDMAGRQLSQQKQVTVPPKTESESKDEICKSCGRTISSFERAIIVDGGLLCSQCEKRQEEAGLNEKPLTDSGASEEQGAGQFVVKCPKCGEGHDPRILRCTKCRTCLRPTFLGVITLLGLVFLPLLAIASLAQVAEHPFALVAFCINVVGIFTLLALRAGKYWAWVAIQVIWVVNIALSAIQAIAVHPALLVGTAVQGLIIIVLWIYINGERVRAFCSVGRPGIGYGPDEEEEVCVSAGDHIGDPPMVADVNCSDSRSGNRDCPQQPQQPLEAKTHNKHAERTGMTPEEFAEMRAQTRRPASTQEGKIGTVPRRAKEEKPVNIVKRIASFILMSAGLVFLIFGLLPTWIDMVKNDLKMIGEDASTPALALLRVLFKWGLSIGIPGIVALWMILGGLGLMLGLPKKPEKKLESTSEAEKGPNGNEGS